MQYAFQTEQSRLEAEGWTCRRAHVIGGSGAEIIATKEIEAEDAMKASTVKRAEDWLHRHYPAGVGMEEDPRVARHNKHKLLALLAELIEDVEAECNSKRTK